MPSFGIIPTRQPKPSPPFVFPIIERVSTMFRTAAKRFPSHPICFATFIICASLVIHVLYLTQITKALTHINPIDHHLKQTGFTDTKPNLPLLFIYRRTKKSGSSAMLDALIHALQPYHYTPLYFTGLSLKAVVRAESFSAFPRRLFVAEHNTITRQDYPLGHTIIADTIRDGYEQVTSFCRYVRQVKTCDKEMVNCLNSEQAKTQNRYRWAGREKEDDDTYIDLPLSSAHPALSTTILRRVFPNITLHIDNWNSANTKCPELPILRNEYSRLYIQLDRQIQTLRKRMLILAGYPIKDDSNLRVDGNSNYSISLEDMLSAAEAEERKKYDIRANTKSKFGFSDVHSELIADVMVWTRGENNSLTLRQGRIL